MNNRQISQGEDAATAQDLRIHFGDGISREAQLEFISLAARAAEETGHPLRLKRNDGTMVEVRSAAMPNLDEFSFHNPDCGCGVGDKEILLELQNLPPKSPVEESAL